jgi:dimethylargininase
MAILARPGADSRRAEVRSVAAALEAYRPLAAIDPPATLDGGDVLRVGRTVYIGLSLRTNQDGLVQMRTLLEPLGYRVVGVPISKCLHLKSAVSQVAEQSVLVRSRWIDEAVFSGLERIEIDAAEPFAANALLVGGAVIYPSAFPRTRERLERRGISTLAVDVREIAKAEGAVTCCSILIDPA